MINLDKIRAEWLQQCGPHDYGMPEYGCACPDGDYRPVMLRLVEEVKRLRAMYDSENAIDIAAARRALADPAPSIPLDEVLARHADPRTELRDRIAEKLTDRFTGRAGPLYGDTYLAFADTVMELFPDVWKQHTASGPCHVARTVVAPAIEGSTDG